MSLNDLRNIFLFLIDLGLFLFTSFLEYEAIFKTPSSDANAEHTGIRAAAESFFDFLISGVSLILLLILGILYYSKRERIIIISIILSLITLAIILLEMDHKILNYLNKN